MRAGALVFRELTAAAGDLALLDRLYADLYVPEFPDEDERESLENIRRYLALKAQGWYGRNNYHVVVAQRREQGIGLSISDYLAVPKAGVIEFLVVAGEARGEGFGAKLLAKTEALFVADAARNGDALSCIAAEMNDPFKSPLDDSLDPFRRAVVWGRWGYRRLDFPYVQPALSGNKNAVANLLLMAKPMRHRYRAELPAALVKDLLCQYMIWAMRIADPQANPVYDAMRRYLDAHAEVSIQSLGAYVGRDPAKPLHVREVGGPDDADAGAVLAVYRDCFPAGPAAVRPEEFTRAAHQSGYHLWAIRRKERGRVEGMASFFGFEAAGFGGYVALAGSLRRTGRFALLLARIEEQMRRDAAGARGLYIECDPAKEPFFRHFGFFTVDCTYRQPPLSGREQYAVSDAPPLVLMYKDFGRNYGSPAVSVSDFLTTMRAIFRLVYDAPEGSPFYADLEAQASSWMSKTIRFRP